MTLRHSKQLDSFLSKLLHICQVTNGVSFNYVSRGSSEKTYKKCSENPIKMDDLGDLGWHFPRDLEPTKLRRCHLDPPKNIPIKHRSPQFRYEVPGCLGLVQQFGVWCYFLVCKEWWSSLGHIRMVIRRLPYLRYFLWNANCMCIRFNYHKGFNVDIAQLFEGTKIRSKWKPACGNPNAVWNKVIQNSDARITYHRVFIQKKHVYFCISNHAMLGVSTYP